MKEKPKQNWFKRHKIWTGVIILFLLFGFISAMNDKTITTAPASTNNASTKSSSTSTQPSPAPAKTATMPKIGQPVRDGKFEFVVNSIKCGETSLSDSLGTTETTAQGQYCRLNITAKNIGTESQSLDETSQYLYNAANNKYSTDTSATIWAQPSEQSPWGNDINPGNSMTADIMYDVPKAVTPTVVELHDSGLSGGVKVSLQ